jgi:hypothetical protein
VTSLRLLALAGAGLFVAGWVVGWFTLVPVDTGVPGAVVRPDRVLAGAPAWLALGLLGIAVAVAFDRRLAAVAWVGALPALGVVALAGALPRRDVVGDETLGEVVRDRVAGQALSLAGALVCVMALVALWRRVTGRSSRETREGVAALSR